MVEEHKRGSEALSSQELENRARKMIKRDKYLRRYVSRYGGSIVILEGEIYDQFQSLADLTDNVEKGGFIYGSEEVFEFKGKKIHAFHFYDYIQCRNVAADVSEAYKAKESCREELEEEAEVYTGVHTHPTDTPPSRRDLMFVGFHLPNILITGGKRKYIIPYVDAGTYIKIGITNSPIAMTLDQPLSQLYEEGIGPFSRDVYKEMSEQEQAEYGNVWGTVEGRL